MSRRKLSRERDIQLFSRKTPHFSIQRIRDEVKTTSRVALVVGNSFKENRLRSNSSDFQESGAVKQASRLIGFPILH